MLIYKLESNEKLKRTKQNGRVIMRMDILINNEVLEDE